MSQANLFTDEDTWNGGFYELAIELGTRSDVRLDLALRTLWQNDLLEGCYAERHIEPTGQERIQPTLERLQHYGHLLGVAMLPNGNKVACGTFTVRQDDDIDWLGFYIPMGSLETFYDIGSYPFYSGKASQKWRESLDEWLVKLAYSVFAVTPFQLALIGDEVSGDTSAAEIVVRGIPEKHGYGYLWKEDTKLGWYPSTAYRM